MLLHIGQGVGFCVCFFRFFCVFFEFNEAYLFFKAHKNSKNPTEANINMNKNVVVIVFYRKKMTVKKYFVKFSSMEKKFLLLIIGFMPVFLVAAENQQIETNIKRPKIGLVLAGGGAKGVAHLPVLKAIEDLNIPIDFIAGTSMGAIIGGFYACGYSADEI